MRKAKFKIEEHRRFNGQSEATVIVQHAGVQGMFTVRPKGSRKTYEKPLADVAAWVIDRCAKEEAERIRATRRTRSSEHGNVNG